MSDGDEVDFRPPRTPERWEALTDEEDRVEENTENEDSELEGAVKIKFRKHIPWKQIARWSKPGKSEEDNQALILQAATDQLKPWIPSYKELHNRKDTDLYCWNRKETYTNMRGVCTTYRCCMAHTCNCPCMLRVIRSEHEIIVAAGVGRLGAESSPNVTRPIVDRWPPADSTGSRRTRCPSYMGRTDVGLSRPVAANVIFVRTNRRSRSTRKYACVLQLSQETSRCLGAPIDAAHCRTFGLGSAIRAWHRSPLPC